MINNNRRHRVRVCALLAVCLLGAGTPYIASASGDFVLVGEMEPLAGVVAQPRQAREALEGRVEATRGLASLEARVRAEWPRLRQIDLVALSRYHVGETRGFELPTEPGELTGRAIGHDETTGLWHLEVRGPRLPARYDIVHRYLHVYAGYDPASGEVGRLTVTIRGWVLE